MEINSKNPLMVSENGMQQFDDPQQSERTLKSSEEKPCSDQFELAVQSTEIAHLNELIQSTPDIREDKVEEARQEIENGTYNVKAEKIAEKILRETENYPT
jgi:negative regulator of flagellin synthesis FlgM